MPAPDAYYDSLFGPEAAVAAPAGVPGGRLGGIKSKLGGMGMKGIGAQLIGLFMLDKILQTKHQAGMRDIQLEGMKRQGELATSENLLGQAALPQAQEEESMARNALLLQLSGGVLGPTVARGNRMIGG
jgi:hypothetical protein